MTKYNPPLTIREWADHERVGYRTALRLARLGELPGSYLLGSRWRVDLEAWEQAIRASGQTKGWP